MKRLSFTSVLVALAFSANAESNPPEGFIPYKPALESDWSQHERRMREYDERILREYDERIRNYDAQLRARGKETRCVTFSVGNTVFTRCNEN